MAEKRNTYELQETARGNESADYVEFQEALKTGNEEDAADMHRLGKSQVLKVGSDTIQVCESLLTTKQRNFSSFSILGLTSVVMGTWEAMIGSSTFSLINGGTAGTVWVYVAVFICTIPVVASLSDMASMAPTSGGQYHWVSEFAPRSHQRFLSYVVGWLSALGWQAAIATTAYSTGTLILELVALNQPSYIPTPWQGTLMTMAVVAVATIFNTILAKRLPLFEGIILFLHIFGFFAILLPLVILSPKAPASEVWGAPGFGNYGGWSSVGAACVIGLLTAAGSVGGSDSAVHMAEEVRNASLVVPRVMITTIFLNGALGFAMTVAFVYCITDIDTMILESTSVFPYIGVFYAATGSQAGATVMTCILIVLTFCTTLSVLAGASRQAWAFGRDEGLPFSSWFRKINTVGTPIPLNAILFSLTITIVLSLINLGSSTAFNSIVGLLAGSGGVSYAISIGCVLLKRVRREELPPQRWSLGRWAIPINAFACLFMIFTTVISFFPLFAAVTPQTMNWGSVMFSGVTVISMVYYFVHGRKVYKGPVVYINRD